MSIHDISIQQKTKVNYFYENQSRFPQRNNAAPESMCEFLEEYRTEGYPEVTRRSSYFEFLPPEIINVEIVKYLDNTSLCKLMQTGKEIYNLIDPLVIYNRKFKKYELMSEYDLIRCNCIHGIDFLIENNLIDKNVFMTANLIRLIILKDCHDVLVYLDNKFNFINNYQERFHSAIMLGTVRSIKNKKVSEYYLKKTNSEYFLKFIKSIFSRMFIEEEDMDNILKLIIGVNAKFNFDLLNLAAECNNCDYFEALVLKGYRFTDIDVIKEIERYRGGYRIPLVFRAMFMFGKKRMLVNVIKKITDPETMYLLFSLIKKCIYRSGFSKEEFVSWINYFCSKIEYQHLKEKFDELVRYDPIDPCAFGPTWYMVI